MNQHQTYKPSMHPVGRTHEAVLLPTDPVFIYKVEGLPIEEHVQIVNLRAQRREPNWQLRWVATDTYTGDYKTAEEALAALEQWINTPNNSSLTIS